MDYVTLCAVREYVPDFVDFKKIKSADKLAPKFGKDLSGKNLSVNQLKDCLRFILCSLWMGCQGGQTEEQTTPQPYSFSYAAGRMPGHVDRVHSEVGDATGTIRGMFSYIDPRQKIRTVEYIADKTGFHPLLITNPVQDTRAVENAKARHYVLYNQIAAEHQRVSEERGQTDQYEEDLYENSGIDPNVLINLPQDTPVVEKAKLRHYDLYNRIAEEHARIAAERGDYGNEEEYEVQPSEEKVVKIGY